MARFHETRIESWAIVADRDHNIAFELLDSDPKIPTFLGLLGDVLQRIFNKRLHGKRRYHRVDTRVHCNLKRQALTHSRLLNLQVITNELNLLIERHGLDVIERGSK